MFKLKSPYQPTGDQPQAIAEIYRHFRAGDKRLTLLGATGTGKTFTMANIIQKLGKKTLVLAHNKTLAGQLYSELKNYFPDNHVEFFISYYDYYQPEAYVASKDLYIEKDSSINDDIDQMRHSAVASLLSYDDVIVVASVSCIYGIGEAEDYLEKMFVLRVGEQYDRQALYRKLVDMQYTRNDYAALRGSFSVRGDVVTIIPASYKEEAIRVEFFDTEIEAIKIMNTVTGAVKASNKLITVYPATLFVVNDERMHQSLARIAEELEERIAYFKQENLLLEAQRIADRTKYDLEMMKELGYCSGIENYSRHLALRAAGETPTTLLDFFKRDFLLIVDESHVTLPQVRAMYNGDRARKQTLVDYGFRLPSALDNRPLKFAEFNARLDQVLYVSATPADYEKADSTAIVEQIIRPTGLLDPLVEVRSPFGQIDDLIAEIKKQIAAGRRALVLTLTIKMSEELTAYFKRINLKVAYLHSEIKSLERLEIIRQLRLGEYDVLVGINLLREGLDIPEVGLIAILDADKEGFLRSETSLIQIIGRAARNAAGKVIMYAEHITQSMEKAIVETLRRRTIQEAYNEEHGITPRTIEKPVSAAIKITRNAEEKILETSDFAKMNKFEKEQTLRELEKKMRKFAQELNFEEAMALRDIINELKGG